MVYFPLKHCCPYNKCKYCPGNITELRLRLLTLVYTVTFLGKTVIILLFFDLKQHLTINYLQLLHSMVSFDKTINSFSRRWLRFWAGSNDIFRDFSSFLFQLIILNLQRFLDTPSGNSMSASLGRWNVC